ISGPREVWPDCLLSVCVCQNVCSRSFVIRTRTTCHSCSISPLMSCPPGYKMAPNSTVQDCTLTMSIDGCSSECYRELEMKKCCPGYWGLHCVECPDQHQAPCSNRGVCSEGLGGNGTCSCQEGFAGTACEDCSPGRFGSNCNSVCTCVHGLCNSGLRGDGSCTCFSGYKGPNCDQESPECVSLRCPGSSRCMEDALSGRMLCQCLPGYQKSGDQCSSINPCLQRRCHVHASCVHTGPNQHLCACNEGYSGDGRVCMAIDPCQTKHGSCSTESTRCVHDGPGKSHCECLPGFYNLSDGGCSMKDSCRPDSCHRNANCTTVGPGQVQCTCLQGYHGNGRVCYGNIMQRLNELNTEPGGQWRGHLSNAIALFGTMMYQTTPVNPDGLRLIQILLVLSISPDHRRIVTMANQILTINVTEKGQILVDGAAVLEAAVEAKNGRLYVVDGILTPSSIEPLLPNRCDVIENKTIKVRFEIGSCRACCKGFYGPDCAPCPGGYQTPCSGHGQCVEGIGGNGSCICDPNFRGSRCQYCSSSKKYGPNCDKTCLCIHGQCDNRPVSDGRCKLDSCWMGFTGRLCDRQTAPCGVQAQFCHAHANCDFSQGETRCVCKPGYQGDGLTCVESDPCAPPLRGGCSMNAKCVRTGPGTHSCQCLTGWTEDGDECQPINNCDGPDRGGCHPNATCINVGPGQSDCSCKAGFRGSGQDCEPVNQCVTANGGCHFLASCQLLSSGWTCVCDEGFGGNGHICFGRDSELSWSLPDHNLTILVPSSAAVRKMSPEDKSFWTMKGNLPSFVRWRLVSNTALCVSRYFIFITAADVNTTRYHVVTSERLLKTDLQHGGYRRTLLGFNFQIAVCERGSVELLQHPECCRGFFGEHCEPCPGPKTQPCFGNGVCLDGLNGTGVCQCEPGFDGTACETCQRGKFGVHCDQDCRCKNGRCSEGILGDGTCECEVGWRGIICDEIKCHTSANCVIRSAGPRCLCAAGFEGNGTSCQAKDPCAVNNGGCSLYAVCKRTRPGLRDCVCNRGYSGDGLVCVEINPCLDANGGCHANADCVHVGPNKTSCACSDGYSGDGQNCKIINLCQKKNGGCHQFARCNMNGPGVRTCSCISNFIGDGLTCRGTVGKELLTRKLSDFYLGLIVKISLKGRGPFTVFAPNKEVKSLQSEKHKEEFANILRSHIVMCHTLLPADLKQPRNLTSLSGLVLTTRSNQGSIFINQATVSYSHDVSINGIFHEINQLLIPPDLDKNQDSDLSVNLTDVAQRHGYKTFYKLLEDTGVMDLVYNGINQPVTVFLPSDGVMASLPQEQKDFLFHQHNRPQLVEYLKYHILQMQKIYAERLIHLDSARTLQGSSLSFSCGGMDDICRIIQRHLIFNGGIAYGIDCLLTPPSLGGRCDEQTTFELQEVQKCDLPTMFVTENLGCRSVCIVNFWQPKCCRGYHGRDCLVCPGGVTSSCSNHGKCDDGHLGNGTCTCEVGFRGVACEQCSDGFYGPTCKACNCSKHGSCDDGRRGTGVCLCEAGWGGEQCDTEQTQVLYCSPPCSPKAVCQENNTCICQPFYEGDGFTCAVVDMCHIWNGGCAPGARCSQMGEEVSCTCPRGHSGDGFTCQPIDPCVSGDNGGCHEHATCTMTGKRKCTCKDGYIGDELNCEVKQLPISRCLHDNGQCHQDAHCTDLHFEDATLGVFHLRSVVGQYKLSFSAAQQICSAEGGTLATYTQLSYAQQGGLNMCAAGWLDGGRVAYPTTYSNPNCGFGHVGIVDYGIRKNLSETWDAFCYRMKDVRCECPVGFVGDGITCSGNLLQVLRTTPTFSNFLTVSTRPGAGVVPGVSCYINNRFLTSGDVLASNGVIHVLQGPLEAPPIRQEVSVVMGTSGNRSKKKKKFKLCISSHLTSDLVSDWLCRCMWLIRQGWASAWCC
uniref:Stabilin 2 n=1 Tax=Echeneis naucrates TaxID=173247 RepID=A0A665V3G4_ECHNA